MKDTTKYAGLDVSKEKIAVAITDAGREAPRYWGTIPHKPEAIRKLIKQLGDGRDVIAKTAHCRGNRYVLVTSHNCRTHLIEPATCMQLGQVGSLFKSFI